MKLTYRGIHYNAAPAFSAAESSGLTVIYRGLNYTARATDAKVMPIQTLMYRGMTIGEAEATYQQVSDPAMA